MKRQLLLGFLLFFMSDWLQATHNRAGQITFRLISGYTYEVTVTTFTYTKSAADRNDLFVDWGDNSGSVVERGTNKVELPNDYWHNKYITNHTFPGPGIYQIMMQDPNRNLGINNIPNSVDVIFSIKTTLVISPDIGRNSSPQLLNFPIDKAAKGHLFIHNPSAYDPDGDSLSYKLTICTGQDGIPISDYKLPAALDTIYVDPVFGDLVWDTPVDTGKYNVAMNIEEWRYGVKIGNITRDMQINVYETDNNPPVNPPIDNYCVVAGDVIEFQVTSTDADLDSIIQIMTGGPFAVTSSPAVFSRLASGRGFSTSTFRWQTNCNHIRRQPWQVSLKSQDVNVDIELIDIDNFTIRVLPPAPENLTSSSTSTEISLSWDQADCGPVAGYYIYRREGNSGFVPDSCEPGLPPYTGFARIATVTGKSNTVFTDDNNGEGLVQGIDYCYRITAFYNDGSESFASEETCHSLVPGFPAMLNVSVTQIDPANGSIFIAWVKPRNFDSGSAPGPYVFWISRSLTPNAADFAVIDSIHTADLDDTTYLDTPLNTVNFPYYYTVKMFNNTPGNRFEMRPGESEIASSLYLEITPNDNQLTLNIRKKAPWINNEYVIYRRLEGEIFDSIGFTGNYQFTDAGLQNGETYYYQVKSKGWRPVEDVIFNNTNLSHENMGTPADLTAPCAPVLYLESHCDSLFNLLTWTNPNHTCADDVIRYRIYYSAGYEVPLDSLTTIEPDTDTTYYHFLPAGLSLSGCYAVSAIDSVGNESPLSVITCVDKCPLYSLPNVFTPNKDGINDIFRSKNLNNVVEKVDMKIFDRFGHLVYETTDPDINWDGKDVSSGVFYYVCDVYEPRITGIEIRTLVGFIHVYAEGHGQILTK